MELGEAIQSIALRYAAVRSTIQTEEATKSALVMPLLSALGYDIFNPSEVLPEFNADIVNRKGEKIDFAILSNNKPIMLIECKRADQPLSEDNIAQLARYFMVVPARIGILTNGVEYEFYSDLDESKILDSTPFFKFNILDINENIIRNLRRFTKPAFNISKILSVAEEMKYHRQIKGYLQKQTERLDEDFVRFLAKQAYKGKITSVQLDRFKDIVQSALSQFLSDKVTERLNKALEDEKEAAIKEEAAEAEKQEEENKVITTVDEIEAYSIIKSILRTKVDAKRIAMRDALSYCAILLDDNNRKPICRLNFSQRNKSVTFFDKNKKETRHKIKDIDDIYDYADLLNQALEAYL